MLRGRRSQKQSQREIFGFDGLEERMKEIQATRGKPRKGKQDDAAPTEVDEDELDPKLPFPMIHPTADWKFYWDLWISACIIWSTLRSHDPPRYIIFF